MFTPPITKTNCTKTNCNDDFSALGKTHYLPNLEVKLSATVWLDCAKGCKALLDLFWGWWEKRTFLVLVEAVRLLVFDSWLLVVLHWWLLTIFFWHIKEPFKHQVTEVKWFNDTLCCICRAAFVISPFLEMCQLSKVSPSPLQTSSCEHDTWLQRESEEKKHL